MPPFNTKKQEEVFLRATQCQTHGNADGSTRRRSFSPALAPKTNRLPCTSATFRLRGHGAAKTGGSCPSAFHQCLSRTQGSSRGCQIESQLSQHEDEVAAPSTDRLIIASTREGTRTTARTAPTPGDTFTSSTRLTVRVGGACTEIRI